MWSTSTLGKGTHLPASKQLYNDTDRTIEMTVFTGGKILGFMLVCSCLGHHVNLTPVMATNDAHQYNTKQSMITRNMQTLIFPAEVVVEMDNTYKIHNQQTSPTSLFAINRGPLWLDYKLDPGVVFRVAMNITNIHTIKRPRPPMSPLGTSNQG